MLEPSKEFYTAYVKMQRALKPIKKSKTGHNWTYASIDDIWESIYPILDEYGFIIESKRRLYGIDGSTVGTGMFLLTRLIHAESMQGIEDISPLMAYGKSSYDDQESGENVTYQRRYALMVLLNLQMEEDRVEKKSRFASGQQYKSNTSNEISSSKVIDYQKAQALIQVLKGFQNGPIIEKNILSFNNVSSLDQLKEDQYERVLRYIKENAAKQVSIGE